MPKESIHENLQRVRRPRVHIKLNVELEDAVPKNELPFLVGVMGDFSGDPMTKDGKLPPLRDRKFIEIDRDSFDTVMQRMTPGLNLRVENTLKGDGSEIPVQLKFEGLEDFEPANIVKQVQPLKKLLDTRDKLKEVLVKFQLDPDYEELLQRILENPDDVQKLAGELGIEAAKKNGGDE